jgi:hypothetical protein
MVDDEEDEDDSQPPQNRKYYMLIGKNIVKGPYSAEQLREHPDFGASVRLARLGSTKASAWKPVEAFEALQPVLAARLAADAASKSAADAAKPGAEAPKPAPKAPPTGHH